MIIIKSMYFFRRIMNKFIIFLRAKLSFDQSGLPDCYSELSIATFFLTFVSISIFFGMVQFVRFNEFHGSSATSFEIACLGAERQHLCMPDASGFSPF